MFRKSRRDPKWVTEHEAAESAARQLFALLDKPYYGFRSAYVIADCLRRGDDGVLSESQRVMFAYYKKNSPDLIASLLADVCGD